ncbi:MAG: T9SS type A sorting domain-containing protein, partial [Ignavibacteriaceae bacterium]|nr:T9SS type A sorting domain-containing protein [Ignavibacteriaceae bacterium]
GLLYKSSNKGDDWELISSAPDEIYTLFAAKNGILYCGTPWGGVPAGHLFKSADNGITWEIVDEFNTISVIDIEENRLGHILIAAGSGVYRSTDNGDSWHQFTSGLLHIPPWKLAVDSLGYVYAGTGVPQMLYITVQSTIPVELISFSAIQIDNNIHLNWQTATELNNHGFEIERKTENSDWRTIGFKEGNGTTTEEQDYSFIDKNLLNGKHQYRLKQIDFDGTFEFSKTIEVEVLVIYNFMLNQNYPNPFNPVTTIRYELAEESIVTLTVYDVLGNEIEMLVNKEKPTGNYEVEFTGTGLPSGIFFYRLQTDSFVEMKKMILIK